MYTVSHFEEDQLQVTRVRSVVRAGNTVYILSSAKKDFLIPIQYLDDASVIALTKVEEGAWVELSYVRTYKTPSKDHTQTIKVTGVQLLAVEKAQAA